jgi:hypothetical protein
MTVLVTGAAVRVGADVVQRLLATGYDVRAIVTRGSTHSTKLARFPDLIVVEADLRTRAWNSKRFVLASTNSTYRPGKPPEIPLTEEIDQGPSDYYGTSKLLSEILLRNRAEQFDIPYSILWFGTVLSPEEAHVIYRLGFLQTQQVQDRRSKLWPLWRRWSNEMPWYQKGRFRENITFIPRNQIFTPAHRANPARVSVRGDLGQRESRLFRVLAGDNAFAAAISFGLSSVRPAPVAGRRAVENRVRGRSSGGQLVRAAQLH